MDGSRLPFNSQYVVNESAKLNFSTNTVQHAIATSTDVECVFSQGQVLLSHIHNWLSSQSIQALMCLNSWSRLGLVKDKDIFAVTVLAEIEGDEDALKEGWDASKLHRLVVFFSPPVATFEQFEYLASLLTACYSRN